LRSPARYADYAGFWDKYKLDRKPFQIPSSALVAKTLKTSFLSHWIVQPFALTGAVRTTRLPTAQLAWIAYCKTH
jgi:hypothetical protein